MSSVMSRINATRGYCDFGHASQFQLAFYHSRLLARFVRVVMSEKRPFFEDHSFTTPSPQQKIPRVEAATDDIPQPDTTEPDIPLPSLAPPQPPQPPVQHHSQLPLFRSIVGDEQPDAELNNLLNICNGDLQMAINAYYSKKDASTSTNSTMTATTTTTTTAPTPGLLYFGDAIIKGIYLVIVSSERICILSMHV